SRRALKGESSALKASRPRAQRGAIRAQSKLRALKGEPSTLKECPSALKTSLPPNKKTMRESRFSHHLIIQHR
ncbi:hypothetical protein AB1K89_14915, partial [Sporosarcina sp. 179-K 8C2 HS]|uniref:hypothetical protein n=1 Tax=Sporosarcina sp. 179-K 8C2 HS TaxID=3142387 RepID=UPI0039A2CC3E